jgi:hypothetical protein
MKYYSVTEYDPEGGFELVHYVDTGGAFQRMDTDVFRRACRAISYDLYQTISLILSELPRASVWLRGEDIRLEFPNPADNM